MDSANDVRTAFEALKQLHEITSKEGICSIDYYKSFAELFNREVFSRNPRELLAIGTSVGIPPASIIGLIILHGGYPDLIMNNIINRKDYKFFESLYHSTWLPLKYNVLQEDVTAPWITLSAQEALLDIDLKSCSVIEYGSGVSTFFFARNCKEVITFEDDETSLDGVRWSSIMKNLATDMHYELSLYALAQDYIDPYIATSMLKKTQEKLLVFIDGPQRERAFLKWSQYIIKNPELDVVLLIDSSDFEFFANIFELLSSFEATIFHHYGYVHGNAVIKSVTSFVTMRPSRLLNGSAAPSKHDSRWGWSMYNPDYISYVNS